MNKFTVIWEKGAELALARLWLDNPRVRRDISQASDKIDHLLAINPQTCGEPSSDRSRQFVQVPLKVLFNVSDEDRVVRVIYVKYWYD
jgi:hypothetical protein